MTGAAYVFDVSTGHQVRELLPSDGMTFDQFGLSVALDDDRILIGAPAHDAAGLNAGTVYLFDVHSGRQLLKYSPLDLAPGDVFARSVALQGNRAVAGAPAHDANGTDSGAAWVFDVSSGTLLHKLLPSDGKPGGWFGESAAMSGDLVLVGSRMTDADPGAAYLFDLSSGQETFKLVASDGQPGDGFGWSVAISGSLALVGAREHGLHGAAYLFDVSTGQQLHKLLPLGPASLFGNSVALSGDRALVADFTYNKVHVYDVGTGDWLYALVPTDAAPDDRFGWSVALSGARALVGAPWDDDLGPSSGSAYVFAVPQSEGLAYCFGDGTGFPCACGNLGGPGEGCANSTGAGATLWAAGSPSASADELVVYASQLPAQPALLFAAQNLLNQGDGLPFGDGLRCAGGGAVRLGVTLPGPDGTAIWGAGLAARGGFGPGDLRRFQAWYRDPAGPCGGGSNLTHALEIGFTP